MGKLIQVLCGILMLFSVSLGSEVYQVHLELNDGRIKVIAQEKIEQRVKRSRSVSRGGRSGVASSWYWELNNMDGETLARESFVDPTVICSGDHSQHVILDSTQFVVQVPVVEGGEILSIFRGGESEHTLVGTPLKVNQRAVPVVSFSLEGGNE